MKSMFSKKSAESWAKKGCLRCGGHCIVKRLRSGKWLACCEAMCWASDLNREEESMQIIDEPTQPSAFLPVDAAERKSIPLVRGLLDYFPAALAAVADVSRRGNDQHNPGQPMHHARGKSTDHADCIVRHLMDRGTVDVDGARHTAKAAWRVLALLQEELEAAGAPLARGAKLPEGDGK